MATNSNDPDGFTFNYEFKLDFNEFGKPSSLYVKAEPEEQEAVNSAIRTALERMRELGSRGSRASSQKHFSEAISEYFSKSQTQALPKATYRSNLDHAQGFLGDAKDVLGINQADFVGYCDRDGKGAEHYLTGSLHDHRRDVPELVSRQVSGPSCAHDKNSNAEKGVT